MADLGNVGYLMVQEDDARRGMKLASFQGV
jgi:hypothetical protein